MLVTHVRVVHEIFNIFPVLHNYSIVYLPPILVKYQLQKYQLEEVEEQFFA